MKYIILLFLAGILSGCSERSIHHKQVLPNNTLQEPKYSSPVHTVNIYENAVTEPNGVLTLRNAVRLTLLHNPELKAYSYNIRAAEARHLQAGLWQNPELEIEVENVGGSGEFSGLDSAETTIQLSQIIKLGDKIGKRKQIFAYDTQLAENEYCAKRLDIACELTKAFITLLFIQKKIELSEELVQISDAIVDSVDKRVQAGKVSSIDLSKARVGMANFKLQQLEITQYYNVTRSKLSSYWNNRTPVFTEAVGQMDELGVLPKIEDLQFFLKNNPEMIQRAVEVQKRKAEMAFADSLRGGDLKIAAGVKHFNDLDDTAFVFGFSIPLSVSDRNQGGRMEAIQQYRKAQEMQKVSAIGVWNEINRLYAGLQTAHTKATILREEVLAGSEEMFNASKISFEQGKKDYLELLDSQRMYFALKNEYIDTLAEYHIAKTELERLVGQSLQSINIKVK